MHASSFTSGIKTGALRSELGKGLADLVALIDYDSNGRNDIEPIGRGSSDHHANGVTVGAREIQAFPQIRSLECHGERNARP